MRVLGLVPARGGSKGIPRKNVRLLGGRPLLAWTADAACAAMRLTRRVLTTDDAEIAETGRRHGLEVPFRRPAELATDSAPALPVVQHAVRWLRDRGEEFDAVCLLQPTHPFRGSGDVDGAIDRLEDSGADSVITVVPVPIEYSPHWVYLQGPDGSLRLSTGAAEPIPRRQEFSLAFRREGSIYVTRTEVLMDGDSFYGSRTVGYEVDPSLDVDLDSEEDWARAEAFLRSGLHSVGIA